jgi:hypothetical protein
MSDRTADSEYRRRRAEVLEGNPLCHWGCGQPATEADHLIEFDIVGDDSPLVASCKPCNARRGAKYLAGKKAAVTHARNEALGLAGTKPKRSKDHDIFLKTEKILPDRKSVV